MAIIIKNSKGDETGELKNLTELRNIKSKFGTIENETYGEVRCHRCSGSGYIVLQEKKHPHYGRVFACNCWKGVAKSEKHPVFNEGLAHGYDYPENINYKKKEKDNVQEN